ESRPPVLSRIVRVNRGPTIPSSEEEATLRLKSPVYQLRFRPNRLSQFHGYPTLGGPGKAAFLNGIASHPPQHHNPQPAAATMDIDESLPGDNQQLPTFTPYIGARALSNMGKFFEHLRENIEALKGTDSDADMEERLFANKVNADDSRAFDWDWDESSEFPSDFAYQHFAEGANTGSAPLTIKWQPPASGFLHRNNRVSSSKFINDADFKRPKFNPSWVKMGLGRRR
ncbi:unnamed protein product, partial [Allacma fusca]